MFAHLADRFVLCPSRDRIAAEHKSRRVLRVDGRDVEVWIEQTDGSLPRTILPSVTGRLNGTTTSCGPRAEPELFVLKFNGAGGRAERTSIHPLDFWSDRPGEVWSPNPPGFGASEGQASLKWLAPAGRAVFEQLLSVAGPRPIVITGNSLGTTVALHVAANYADVPNLVGLVLRNPPPLSHLIAGKYGWRTLGVSRLVAAKVPRELDSVANAARVKLPGVFLCAGRDRVVPPRFQQLITAAYAGPQQVVAVPEADHVFDLAEPIIAQYGAALDWLRGRAGIQNSEFRMQNAG